MNLKILSSENINVISLREFIWICANLAIRWPCSDCQIGARSHKSCNKCEYKLAQWSLAGFPDSLFTRESKNDTNYQLGDYSKFALALSLAGWRVKIYWEPNHFSKRFKDFEETSVDFIGFIHNPPTWTLQVKSFFKVFTNCELVISNEDYLNDHQHREKGIGVVGHRDNLTWASFAIRDQRTVAL